MLPDRSNAASTEESLPHCQRRLSRDWRLKGAAVRDSSAERWRRRCASPRRRACSRRRSMRRRSPLLSRDQAVAPPASAGMRQTSGATRMPSAVHGPPLTRSRIDRREETAGKMDFDRSCVLYSKSYNHCRFQVNTITFF